MQTGLCRVGGGATGGVLRLVFRVWGYGVMGVQLRPKIKIVRGFFLNRDSSLEVITI